MTLKHTPKKNTFRGLKPLSDTLGNVHKQVYRRRGFTHVKLISDWSLIVGDLLGQCSYPKRLVFPRDTRNNGTLHVEVYNSSLAVEMSFLQPLILEKIATYFGYRAISQLKIIQNTSARPLAAPPPAKKPVTLTKESQQSLDHLLEEIDDPELKKLLCSLGTSVMAKKPDNTS